MNLTAEQIVQSWGWVDAPRDILSRAESYVGMMYQKVEHIVASLNIIDKQDIDSIVRDKPDHRIMLDWLSQHSSEVRENIGLIQSITMGCQFVDLNKTFFEVHPDLITNKDLQKEADAFRAYIVLCQSRTPILVFSEAADYKVFSQLAGPSLANSTILRHFPDIKLAIGPRDSVMRALNSVLTSNGSDNNQSVSVVHSSALRDNESLKVLDDIHSTTLKDGSTDIHIDVVPSGEIEVRYRIHGDMHSMPIRLTSEQYLSVIRYLLKASDAQRSSSIMVDPADGRYQYADRNGNVVNVRASFIPSQHVQVNNAPAISARLRLQMMNDGEVDLAEKGIAPEVIRLIEPMIKQGQGLILLVGPTNSGKSTTIAGLLSKHREIYGDKKCRLSAEDPVERFIGGMNQFEVAVHRRGKDGFATLSKNFMRHDPDLIFLGEIRDAETAEHAVQFADTGHLVFSTLHAKTASSALQRLLNTLPVEKALLRQAAIESTNLILAQRLVKKVCQHCASPFRDLNTTELNEIEQLSALRGLDIKHPSRVRDLNPKGCSECRYTGIAGVMPINDVMVLDDKTRGDLMEPGAKLAQVARQSVRISFEDMASKYIEQGLTTWEAILV